MAWLYSKNVTHILCDSPIGVYWRLYKFSLVATDTSSKIVFARSLESQYQGSLYYSLDLGSPLLLQALLKADSLIGY